jgi:hypothetical protein
MVVFSILIQYFMYFRAPLILGLSTKHLHLYKEHFQIKMTWLLMLSGTKGFVIINDSRCTYILHVSTTFFYWKKNIYPLPKKETQHVNKYNLLIYTEIWHSGCSDFKVHSNVKILASFYMSQPLILLHHQTLASRCRRLSAAPK